MVESSSVLMRWCIKKDKLLKNKSIFSSGSTLYLHLCTSFERKNIESFRLCFSKQYEVIGSSSGWGSAIKSIRCRGSWKGRLCLSHFIVPHCIFDSLFRSAELSQNQSLFSFILNILSMMDWLCPANANKYITTSNQPETLASSTRCY